ncbi:MAG: flagellar filament capping protein FliD [Nitrospinae bacterium]|nr:flagellar filament capping protein FliD [Nitrospinota bacterium]
MATTSTTSTTTTNPLSTLLNTGGGNSGLLSISGLASGMDTTSIINQLVSLTKQPATSLANQQTANNNKISQWNSLTTMLNTLQSSVSTLRNPTTFMGTLASFTNSVAGNPSIMNLSTTSNITPGSHSVTVGALAKQQQSVSAQSYASTTATIGGFTGLTIATSANGTQTFTQNTLQSLAAAVNGSSLGVTANVVNTAASGATPAYVMQLSANNSGTANSFVATTNGTASGTLTGTLDFANTTGQVATLGGASVFQASANAAVTVDGISLSRSSNTITDAISGLSMSVTALGSGTINLTNDVPTTVANVQTFVNAYNSVMGFINTQNTYDPKAASQQPLFADPSLQNIQSTLRGLVSGASAGTTSTSSVYSSMSQIGINSSQANNFAVSLDTNALTSALQTNASAVQNLFTPGGSGTDSAASYTFISSLGNATPGTYNTQVVGGVLQMQKQGTGTWISMTQAGTIYTGPSGSALDGVNIQATSLGTTGTYTLWGGSAQMMYQSLNNDTLFQTGMIPVETASLLRNNTDLQKQIDTINTRASALQSTLQLQFTNLETHLSKLQAQGQFLTQQLNYLPGWSMPANKSSS